MGVAESIFELKELHRPYTLDYEEAIRIKLNEGERVKICGGGKCIQVERADAKDKYKILDFEADIQRLLGIGETIHFGKKIAGIEFSSDIKKKGLYFSLRAENNCIIVKSYLEEPKLEVKKEKSSTRVLQNTP